MKRTTIPILTALLAVTVSLAIACSGTLDLQIETTPAAEATITALEEETSRLATQVAHHESRLGQLAYVHGGDIWVKTLPDGEPRRLTDDGRNSEPRWSPSGEWLAFRKGDHDRAWITRAAGETSRQANRGEPVDAFAWSPVEDRLAIIDGVNGELRLQSPDTGDSTVLVGDSWGGSTASPPEGTRRVEAIAWSPDGTSIAFTVRQQPRQAGEATGPPSYQAIWTVPVDGGEAEELYDSGVSARGAAHLFGWAADGEHLLFWQGDVLSASMLADGIPLYTLPADGAERFQVTNAVLHHQDFVAPAPTGSRVAVVAGAGRSTWSNKRIAVAQPNAGFAYLTSENVAAISPTWSPDGSWLAYSAMPDQADVVGGEQARQALMDRSIWLVDPDGAEPQQLPHDPSYRDEWPLWSADGSYVLFARLDAEDRASLWITPVEGESPQQVVEELTPAPEWFGTYGHIDWNQHFDWWRGDMRPVTTTGQPSPPPPPTASPTPSVMGRQGTFTASRAALADYEPAQNAVVVVDALSQECANWLSGGRDPTTLLEALRSLPKLASADVEITTVDLNDDGLSDVVIEPQFPGLSVLACLAQGEERYTCRPMPDPGAFGEREYTTQGDVSSSDFTGDSRSETVITYTVQGGSSWTELLYVFRWPEPTSSDIVFHAALVNWAGPSSWRAEPDPAAPGRQQIVLTYPHLYDHAFDHKMVNHPLGRQIWRWDDDAERFVLSEKEVDMTQSGSGPDAKITVEDRLRWLANEAETAFRAGQYEEALKTCEEALAFAAAEAWKPTDEAPDWRGLLRFRRAQILAYLGRSAEALTAMQDLALDYDGSQLGELADAFLSGYGDGSSADAALEAYAAVQDLKERLRDSALIRFPVTVEDILCCEPGSSVQTSSEESRWPEVGVFETDP